MKSRLIITAFAAASTILSLVAFATEPDTSARVENQSVKKAAPHSHVQDKYGIPSSVPSNDRAATVSAANDRSKHFHPRDR